ncbi:MAG: RimK-like ATPgrasp N-terminal domain-containing protein [Bdellovibrionota bacterium]
MKKNVLIVDVKYKQKLQISNCEIKSPLEFVLEVPEKVPAKVFNISSDMGYQEIGYYASLLAIARNNKVLPEPKILQNLKDRHTQYINDEIDELMQSKLKKYKIRKKFELKCLHGQKSD